MPTPNAPMVGQTIPFRGTTATIIKVHPLGTIDVETASGNCYRVSGLAFLCAEYTK